jgi:glycoside hydrolase-like protein
VSRSAARAVQAARAGTTFTGLGFDTCLTPSLDAMAAWAASPYRAVNMYVGGASRGCPNQPNLNATWVDTVVGQGWTLIPTYVGLQAPCATRYPNRVSAAGAVAEGTASADDAINVLNAIGLGVGSIVYFDMEAYDTGNAGCVAAVQAFLDAWTVRLHARGYLSGVYTSSSPMGPTLVARLGDPSFHQPDDIWFARWNGSATTTGDPAIPDSAWASHQRIHQYLGGHVETYGGVSINIDSNAVDADTAPGAPLAEGTFLSRRGETAVYRIAGGAPLPVTSWAAFGAPQPVEVVSATRWRLLPTYPRNGSFLQGGSGRVFQVVGGVARFVRSWDAFGGPQPTTLVDQAALDNAGTGGVFNHLKRGAPAVAMLAPAGGVGLAAATQRVRWVGAFTAPAIRSYDLRYRRSRYTGGFGPWTSPKPWQNTAASGKTKGLLAGYNYCYQVRATSRAGQTTPWSASRCAARALDDRSLTASSGWRRWKAKAFYTRTVTSTTRKGVTLSVSRAVVQRVGVVATTCAACGRLSVIVDGRRVGAISLVSPTTVRRAVLMTPRFGLRSGRVTVKSLTSGRRVQVDGLVLTRT